MNTLTLILLLIGGAAPTPATELIEVDYVRTIDGDTIVVSGGADELHVRLLAIDAVDMIEGTPAAFAAGLALSTWLTEAETVYIEYDAADPQDFFHRELCWVWYRDTSDVLHLANVELFTAGLCTLYEDTTTARYAEFLIEGSNPENFRQH